MGTIESSIPGEIDPKFGPLVYHVRMVVDEVFFGDLQAESRIEFDQLAVGETGANPEARERYFIYANRSDGSGFGLGVCSGSQPLKWAEEDIAFARALEGGRPKPALRGWVRSSTQPYDNSLGIEGARITVSGPSGQVETTTDRGGKFILEGMAPGRYRIQASYPGYRPDPHFEPEIEVPAAGCSYSRILMVPAN
jgi:Carboxypeptidase regulatory-like domain